MGISQSFSQLKEEIMTPEEEYFKNTSIEQIRKDLEEILKDISILTYEGLINGSG